MDTIGMTLIEKTRKEIEARDEKGKGKESIMGCFREYMRCLHAVQSRVYRAITAVKSEAAVEMSHEEVMGQVNDLILVGKWAQTNLAI